MGKVSFLDTIKERCAMSFILGISEVITLARSLFLHDPTHGAWIFRLKEDSFRINSKLSRNSLYCQSIHFVQASFRYTQSLPFGAGVSVRPRSQRSQIALSRSGTRELNTRIRKGRRNGSR